jgi:hypothetical protein
MLPTPARLKELWFSPKPTAPATGFSNSVASPASFVDGLIDPQRTNSSFSASPVFEIEK